jgi:phage-related protein
MVELPSNPEPRPVKWLGSSKKDLKAFPARVCDDMGYALFFVQCGVTPDNAKPFHGVGSGVFELVESHNKNAYRMVYGVQIGQKVYVLHAFQKKSKQGKETPKLDVELIKKRYKEALEHAKHDKKTKN